MMQLLCAAETVPPDRTILSIVVDAAKPSVTIELSWMLILVVVLLVSVGTLILRSERVRRILGRLEILELSLGGAPTLSVSVDKSEENVYIAHRILVELETRKAAIDVDPEKDVIEEVYNSWYMLFGILRDEVKNVPAKYLRRNETRELLRITRAVLNDCLRPQLTDYQAEFRQWYVSAKEAQKAATDAKSPQELQVEYPRYGELIRDMKRVNGELREYANQLRKLIS